MELNDLLRYGFDGQRALQAVLEQSPYRSLEQAVAALAAFSHPGTVKLTKGRNLFCVIRTRDNPSRGKIVELGKEGRAVLDDNEAPTNAFIWAHGINRRSYRDVQFNHLWSAPGDIATYTNLANLCMMPAFLSKLTDTHPEIRDLLRYRALDLYDGYHPAAGKVLSRPSGYQKLRWAAPLAFAPDIERRFRKEMSTKPKSRTTISAREIGWFFSDYRPDKKIGGVSA